MVEQEIVYGPRNYYVPAEAFKPVFDEVRLLLGKGIIVVEAAGNGNNRDVGENLDDPYWSQGSDGRGHYAFAPFRPNEVDANGVITYQYQSGAIIRLYSR